MYVLYGMPASYYSAKVRAYLRRRQIPFEERVAGDPRFSAEILPKIGRWIIPVLQCPDGRILQDGTDILDHLDKSAPPDQALRPSSPKHRLIAHIFELFGSEGLLRPAMHYRWNFDATNLAFLRADFALSLAPGGSHERAEAVFAKASERMRRAAAAIGVSEASIPAIEAAYLEFLDAFNTHLGQSPYLLGGHPTLGDYALLGPLSAHLGRDPYPSALMKQRAIHVWRWVERMNTPNLDQGEYGPITWELFAQDDVPASLTTLLRLVASDYLPEIAAHVDFANAWLAQHPDIAPGTLGIDPPSARAIGFTSFDWRGTRMNIAVMPYRLYLLQRIQDVFDAAGAKDKASLLVLLDAVGLTPLIGLRTARRVERHNHLEIWG